MQIGSATGELTQDLGRSPTPRELAERIGVTVEEVLEGIESSNAYSTLSLDASDKGTIVYDWDGKTAAGEKAGDGPFKVTVAATNGAAPVAARGLVWAPVASVAIPASGVAQLTVPGIGTVPVTAVRQVG